jgi:hypothetical protein
MGEVLNVFVDESNNGRKPIVVATFFSTNPALVKMKQWIMGASRNSRKMRPSKEETKVLLNGGDYRYVVDTNNVLGVNSHAIVRATPRLVEDFIYKEKEVYEHLRVFIDGEMGLDAIGRLRAALPAPATIVCCCKNRNTQIEYPDGLRYADGLAHTLYRCYDNGSLERDTWTKKQEVVIKRNGRS